MFDPAAASARMNPGDKMSVSFHKAKAEPGGSFVDNARSAGMVPGGPSNAAPPMPAQHLMPQLMAVSHAVPDHRALLLAHLRRRMMLGH
jgi:hypothetical protein